MSIKIITYNVNGIRAASKKGLIEWLSVVNPDIVCIQETKALPEQMPLQEIEKIGYKHYWFSAKKKGYSGVGILTKIKPLNVIYGMGIKEYDDEGRFIQADFPNFSIISVYHPSGSSGEIRQTFKMNWLNAFEKHINKIKKNNPNLIIAGDFNICHTAKDIHNPKGNANNSGFLPVERKWIDNFITSGFIDAFRLNNEEPNHYTWWSYRFNSRANNKGWRIDYHMVNEKLKKNIIRTVILPDAIHSDHCPQLLEINF